MGKSCTWTGSGRPFGRSSRPPFLKSPTSSFFFVSTEITGWPAAWNAFTSALMYSNCASRSGWLTPSRVLLFACRLKPRRRSRRPTNFWPAMKPRSASAADRRRWLLLTHRKAASGSPRIDDCTSSFNASKSPGWVSIAGLLPPPRRRTRPPNCSAPASRSARPRPMVLRATPVARETSATPPRPAARASQAANRRLSFSFRTGESASKRAVIAAVSIIQAGYSLQPSSHGNCRIRSLRSCPTPDSFLPIRLFGLGPLRLFNAYYDEYGFQPIVVFDGDGRLVGAVLRPARRPDGREIVTLLRRLIARIRGHWPRVEILLRGDSHYCTPEVLRFCRANRVDYALGVAPTTTLRRHIGNLEQSTAARFAAAGAPDKLRRFKEFYDGAASWDRVERIIARVEAGPDGVDTRFIVTNLAAGSPRTIYQKVYCQRGQAENHIKSFKTHLAADRTSCHTASANQLRLFLHAGAYWMMWGLRSLMPRRSSWRVMQFDTLRLRLIKVAARVVDLKRQVKLHLPTSTPDQTIFALVLARLPQLVI